jgi:hypothetical protein
MAITLGKDSSGVPSFGEGIISATYTEECETIDISNRSNVSGSVGTPGRRVSKAGFTTKTWEIECHDADGVIENLTAAGSSGFTVMSVSENIGVDGAVTYSVTLKEF